MWPWVVDPIIVVVEISSPESLTGSTMDSASIGFWGDKGSLNLTIVVSSVVEPCVSGVLVAVTPVTCASLAVESSNVGSTVGEWWKELALEDVPGADSDWSGVSLVICVATSKSKELGRGTASGTYSECESYSSLDEEWRSMVSRTDNTSRADSFFNTKSLPRIFQ